MCVILRKELMAELLEDEETSMEFARLEEEYRILTEENQNLITVHSERAQQLETLRVVSQKRQGSSWPLTPMRKIFLFWVFTTAYKHLGAPLVVMVMYWSGKLILDQCSYTETLNQCVYIYIYFKILWVLFRADGLVAQTWGEEVTSLIYVWICILNIYYFFVWFKGVFVDSLAYIVQLKLYQCFIM